MDALQYLDVLEARLANGNDDGRLEKVIAKLAWVSDEFAALRREGTPTRLRDQRDRLIRIAELMDTVSDCMSDYLAADRAPDE